MPFLSTALYFLTRPEELRAPVHERKEEEEAITLRKCFQYLELTSRSFSVVIQELNPELLVPVCLFYLILRGLDTIEDDMSIAIAEKDPLLRDFHTVLDRHGWTYCGNDEKEKDRELLVHFDNVVAEFAKLPAPYRVIIADITRRMGAGMAENAAVAADAERAAKGIDAVAEYERYCHHVAGVVGEGLTRLFVESGLANEALLRRPDLHESMGQFLQQINIIRDVREDFDAGRRFWPRQVWAKHVRRFDDLFDPVHQDAALACLSELVLLALGRAEDCLFYLAGMRDQSVFNFAAIPQAMAIATLALAFRNPDVFGKNVKITKGQACHAMVHSTQNLELLYAVFRSYVRLIHKKNDPRDPNYLQISIACGKVPRGKAPRPAGIPLVPPEPTLTSREKLYISLTILATFVAVALIMVLFVWAAGERFDLAIKRVLRGTMIGPAPPTKDGQAPVEHRDMRGEL